MTMSTDVAPSRRAISASRLRSTHHGKFLRRLLEQSRIFFFYADRRYGNDSSDDNCNGKLVLASVFFFFQLVNLPFVIV